MNLKVALILLFVYFVLLIDDGISAPDSRKINGGLLPTPLPKAKRVSWKEYEENLKNNQPRNESASASEEKPAESSSFIEKVGETVKYWWNEIF